MNFELTVQDIDNLIEALDSWVNKGMAGKMMGHLMGAMICRDEESKAAWEAKNREDEAKEAHEQNARKEDAAILKTKLILLRREILAQEATGLPKETPSAAYARGFMEGQKNGVQMMDVIVTGGGK